MQTLLRIFFHLLYHPFAFAYDLVSWLVSFGRWNDWIREVVPFINGTQILELGHGPGHLQRFLLERNSFSIAMDQSPQMGRLAQRNTRNHARLIRGSAQELPFSDLTFDTIVCTFPTEYFYDPKTISEVRRCLSDGGRYIVLPVAFPKNRFLNWIFKITGESPNTLDQELTEKFKEPFAKSDFEVEVLRIEKRSSTLLVIVATK